MTPRKMEAELKRHKFHFERTATHGAIWKLGSDVICVPRKFDEPRAIHNFKAQLKRILSKHIPRESEPMKPSVDLSSLKTKFTLDKPSAIVITPPAPPPEPIVIERLQRKTREQRARDGRVLYHELEAKNFPLINKEDAANLYSYANFEQPSSIIFQILSGNTKTVHFIKDEHGHVLFESKDIYLQIKDRIPTPAPAAPVAPTPPVPPNLWSQAGVTPPPTSLFTVGPFSKEVSDFYLSLAKSKGVTVIAVINYLLIQKAKEEIEKLEQQFRSEFEKRKSEMMKDLLEDL